MARVALSGLTALLTLAGAVVVDAQERRSPPKYGTMRLGPLYLSPQLSFTAGFDDNVYNTPTGIADESVMVGPSLQVVLPVTRRARLKGNGGIVPQYFHTEAKERHTDLSGQLSAEVDAGPLTVSGGVGAGKLWQRFSLEIDERIMRREKSDVLGGTLHIGHRIATSVSQTRTRFLYDPAAELDGNPVNVALDRQSVVRRLDFSVPLTRKTSLSPWIDVVEDRFLRSPVGLPRVVRSQRYAVALDFGELAFLTGRVAAGVRHFGASEGVPPYDGLFLAVNVGMPFIKHTRLQISSNRDVAYSAIPAAESDVRNTSVNSVHRGELLFELPWQFHGRASVAYAETEYLAPTAPDSTSSVRRDHAWTVGGALLRRFGAHVSLGGLVERADRRSPIDQHSYKGTRYLFTGEVR